MNKERKGKVLKDGKKEIEERQVKTTEEEKVGKNSKL